MSEKGYRFIGWYEGENLVYEGTMYEFTAKKDGEFVAKFEEYSKWESSLETPETPETPDGSDEGESSTETESSDTAIENESVATDSSKEGEEKGCKSSSFAMPAVLSALAYMFFNRKKKRA